MKKVVLYGVLNWGLGHATRSIPIIRSLIELDYEPIICSDGDALTLLRKEFPKLECVTLPAYHIQYRYRSMLANVSRYGIGLLKAIYQEQAILRELTAKYQPRYIISDNRYGFHHDEIPSIMITHQLRIPADAAWQSKIASNFLHNYINKFDTCWVPDAAKAMNLSGKLSHDIQLDIPIEYIGALSRFSPQTNTPKYDIACILSGPEPQRSHLEILILQQANQLAKKMILVRGTAVTRRIDDAGDSNDFDIIDMADSESLQRIISESKLVLSRAGYTTIMDLVAMQKPAILIPTPGQPEQEYLAEHLATHFTGFRFLAQDDFHLSSAVDPLPTWDATEIELAWSTQKLAHLLEVLV